MTRRSTKLLGVEIIDAQIHEPLPVAPWPYGEESRVRLSCELAREAMDCVGVDAALLQAREIFCRSAISLYPDRFAACEIVDPNRPDLDDLLRLIETRLEC